MGVSVLPDLVRESKANSTATEQLVYRAFFVSGLPSDTPDNMTMAAQTATDSISGLSIPAMFAVHPAKPELYVDGINAEPVGGNAFNVVVRYIYKVYPSAFQMDFHGGIQAQTSYVDGLGHPTKLNARWSGDTAGEVVGVPRNFPVSTTTFRIIESTSPTNLSALNAGSVNSAAWMGAAIGTLRFNGITGRSNNLIVFENDYSFSYSIYGWNAVYVYATPSGTIDGSITPTSTGGTTAGGAQGTGFAWFQMTPWIDFNTVLSNLTSTLGSRNLFG